jgi:hypothetical protein
VLLAPSPNARDSTPSGPLSEALAEQPRSPGGRKRERTSGWSRWYSHLPAASVELARARGSTRSRSQPSAASIPWPFARLERATVEPQPYRPPLVVLLSRAPRHAWTSIQLAPNGCLRSRASLLLLISSSCPVRWPARSHDALVANAPLALAHRGDAIARREYIIARRRHRMPWPFATAGRYLCHP